MFGTDNVVCKTCNKYVSVEDCWLADEGILCKPCCEKAYPEKFRSCHCGVCYSCVTSSKKHYHEWKQYVGIREVYDYCECGEKRYK